MLGGQIEQSPYYKEADLIPFSHVLQVSTSVFILFLILQKHIGHVHCR